MQKCRDANFCQRLRGARNGARYAIDPSSVNTNDRGAFTAAVTNADAPGARFSLEIRAYEGGTVRMLLDEPAANPARYRVQDVLLPDVESKARRWASVKPSNGGYSLSLGDATVHVSLAPFRVSLESHGQPAAAINGRDMFAFEHRRAKQDGDPAGMWEETFLGHADSKPRGPEAMALDLFFPGE